MISGGRPHFVRTMCDEAGSMVVAPDRHGEPVCCVLNDEVEPFGFQRLPEFGVQADAPRIADQQDITNRAFVGMRALPSQCRKVSVVKNEDISPDGT